MRLKIPAATTLVLLLMAGSAGAQFQYIPPGGPEEKPASRKEALDLELSRAHYRLGPVRVAPWASLHDVGYVRSLLTTGRQLPADFTATAGAGFRAYVRNGPKVTWSAGVLPEYLWWRKQASRRRVDDSARDGEVVEAERRSFDDEMIDGVDPPPVEVDACDAAPTLGENVRE